MYETFFTLPIAPSVKNIRHPSEPVSKTQKATEKSVAFCHGLHWQPFHWSAQAERGRLPADSIGHFDRIST